MYDKIQNIDPNSDESAIVRVLVLSRMGPLNKNITKDLERVCSLALKQINSHH